LENAMTTWNPDQYLKFSNERTRPALDLASQIEIKKPKRIIDLGCGTGTSTEILAKKWPQAEITGLDSSEEMLNKAQAAHPNITWVKQDLNEWIPDQKYDIIFSNASLQWINPVESLIASSIEALNEGGAFAFQVPNNHDSPYHTCIIEAASRPQWKMKMEQVVNPLRYDSINFYYDLLSKRVSKIIAWETRYFQIMEGPEAILEWVSGTALGPYLQVLGSEKERVSFKADLLNFYRKSFPASSDGKVIFPFNRQFLIAYK
jgi:trans-aconitate 2-methyltransferase